jgi:hypothetical protein
MAVLTLITLALTVWSNTECMASPPGVEPTKATLPERVATSEVSSTDTLDDLLLATGMTRHIENLSVIVEGELAALSGAGFFAPGEIDKVGAELRSVREDDLYQLLRKKLQGAFTTREWKRLRTWSQTPGLDSLLAGEERLQTKEGLAERDAYLLTLSEKPPHPQRLELMEALSDARSRVLLETLTRIELRRNLLSAISRAKTGKPLSEQALRRELHGYDKTLRSSLTSSRRDDYLFVLRHTPSDKIHTILKLHDDGLYVRFMQIATKTLREGIAIHRQ